MCWRTRTCYNGLAVDLAFGSMHESPDLGRGSTCRSLCISRLVETTPHLTRWPRRDWRSALCRRGAGLTALTYLTGHARFCRLSLLVRFAPAGELTVFCGALVAGPCGFAWYRSAPGRSVSGATSIARPRRARDESPSYQAELLLVILRRWVLCSSTPRSYQVGRSSCGGKRVACKEAPLHHTTVELMGWQNPSDHAF